MAAGKWATAHDESWRDLSVAVSHAPELGAYPGLKQIPFDPDTQYPEYHGPVSSTPNPVYGAVRRVLGLLRRDPDHMDRPEWNPLRGLVEPGMKVVLKPNWVADTLRCEADLPALFTHMSVIRPVIDYVRSALRGDGQITLGDAPIQRTNWDNLMAISGAAKTLDQLDERGPVSIDLVDLRREVTVRDRLGMVMERELRDSIDYLEVDLGTGSALTPVIDDYRKFRVSQYDPQALLQHHNHKRNSYMIHKCVLDADLVIGLPKLKVHKKAGITCALKNLVGTVCGKDWLPHFRVGDVQSGAGDQYAEKSRLRELYTVLCYAVEVGGPVKRRIASILRKGVSGLLKLQGGDRSCEGNWYGNDTTWRMVHDLNVILCYATAQGHMTDVVQRRTFHVVDGIIVGEGDAPLQPTARAAGIIMAGTNPLAVDGAAATLIGFDTRRTPLLRDAWKAPGSWQIPPKAGTLADVVVTLECEGVLEELRLDQLGERINLGLDPPPGWLGMIERATQVRSGNGGL